MSDPFDKLPHSRPPTWPTRILSNDSLAKRPERHSAVELEVATTADGAVAHRLERGSNDGRVDQCVGVHEDQEIALRRAGSGVTGRGDLPVSDLDDTSSVLFRHGNGSITRGVISHDDFMGLAEGLSSGVQAAQRGP
jgi:hypothetical protein